MGAMLAKRAQRDGEHAHDERGHGTQPPITGSVTEYCVPEEIATHTLTHFLLEIRPVFNRLPNRSELSARGG